MKIGNRWVAILLGIVAVCTTMPANAEFVPGTTAPNLKAQDIYDTLVDLKLIAEKNPSLVVLFFFTIASGEDIALKLDYLDQKYGSEMLQVVALGWRDDKDALKEFAENRDINYHIIDPAETQSLPWRDSVLGLPMTVFLTTGDEPSIERVLYGSGDNNIIIEIAENWFQQGKTQALDAAADAIEKGESTSDAKELKGFILTAEGKLDEAELEFGEIESKTGLAKVALERGDYDAAVGYADDAGTGYAQAIKGEAYMRSGDFEKAAAALGDAPDSAERAWQKSAAVNAQGRLEQAQGNPDAAVGKYQQAVSLDPYNVVALSNEGAVHREQGDLDAAQAVLQKAADVRADDPLVLAMLQQVSRELEEANDIKRQELIQSQITDLAARFTEMKASGALDAVDSWTTRPLVLALLPGNSEAFFPRAGTNVVLQRELEARLNSDGRVQVVEREMLAELLQELNLGSSELADASTQQQLGRVLSAGLLGFIDFAQVGGDTLMYLRFVDTETTSIFHQASYSLDARNPLAAVDGAVSETLAKLADGRELKGVIADVSDPDNILIGLGKKHGVQVGDRFTVLVEGDPVEVGGRVIAHRQKPVAKLEVSAVEDEYAVCTASNVRDGVALAKEMKIRSDS